MVDFDLVFSNPDNCFWAPVKVAVTDENSTSLYFHFIFITDSDQRSLRSSYETASTFMEEEPKVINYKQFKILSMDEETKQREAEIKREVS